MIDYRPFRNTDSPLLVELWRRAAASRPLVQPLSLALFEQLVLAKPYFDRRGLIVATEAGQPIGFAHAGFGPAADGSGSTTDTGSATQRGSTCLVVVPPPAAEEAISAELLARCEAYLRGRGAMVLYGGSPDPFASFYLGLYGGSEAGGVPESDAAAQHLFRSASYVEAGRWQVLRRDFAKLRPIV
ncbi:MAG: hypothetical protein WD176_10000, partial [Pirellulales bacterium]